MIGGLIASGAPIRRVRRRLCIIANVGLVISKLKQVALDGCDAVMDIMA
jgi:hypothetical protein